MLTYEPLTQARASELGLAIVALGSDNSWETWTTENLLADRPGKWELSWLVLDAETPVAYSVSSRKGDSVHLHHLIVGRKWRRLGVGRELLRRLAREASRLGVERITLKAYRENEEAIRLYRRCGFRVCEESGPEPLSLVAEVSDVMNRLRSDG